MYQLQGNIILRTNADESLTSIPLNPENTDYAAYQEWVDAGNVAQEAPQPAAPIEAPVTAAALQEQLNSIQGQVTALAAAPVQAAKLQPGS